MTSANNGPSLAVQTTASSFGSGLQLGEILVANDMVNLYVSIPGNNNDSTGTGIYLFIDSVAGGASNIATDPSGGYSEFDVLATPGGGAMPTGFAADMVLYLKRTIEGGDLGTWDLGTNNAAFRGTTGAYTGGFNAGQNNTNVTAVPWASGAVTTGVELQIPLSALGSPALGSTVKLFAIGGNYFGAGANNTAYMSNQILPNSGSPGSFGRDGAGGLDGPGVNYNGSGGPNVTPLQYTLAPASHQPGKTGDLTVSSTVTLNRYASLRDNATAGATEITLDLVNAIHTSGDPFLSVGDLLMLYVAKDATINTSNTFNYGEVTSLNNAGLYELVTVGALAIDGSRVRITIHGDCGGGLRSSYGGGNPGATQVIYVPQYDNLTITAAGTVVPTAWNGSLGGVVALHVNGTLTVNGSISASQRGFRGGVLEDIFGDFNSTEYITNSGTRSAFKGESIAVTPADARGRGAAANGGGGGNGHNSGGGGGANGDNGNGWTIGSPAVNGGQGVMIRDANPNFVPPGAYDAAWMLDPTYLQITGFTNSAGGGRGGYTYADANQNPASVGPANAAWGGDVRRELGGLGGRPVANDPAPGSRRMFMGGGGGAGDANNASGGRGGHGAGVIFIMANQVTGIGSIVSNGEKGQSSQNTINDAPGGGGAGGTIVLRGNNVASSLAMTVNGGAGGDQLWGTPGSGNETEGPGGGGGGGYIAVLGGTPTRAALGGLPGTNNRPFMAPMPSNGATAGASGQPTEATDLLALCAGTLSGRVFNDYNGNGTQDPGEPGLAGVPVLITPAAGDPLTVLTDATGSYNALIPTGLADAEVDDSSPNIPPASVITTGLPGGNRDQTGLSIAGGLNTNATPVGYQQVEPDLVFDENPSVLSTGSGSTFTYTLTFTNNATPSTLAAATNVVMVNTFPRFGTWGNQIQQVRSHVFGGGFTGTVTDNGTGVFTITLDQDILPGETGSITFTVKTATPVTAESLLNAATLNADTQLGTALPQLSDNSVVSTNVLMVDLVSFTVTRRQADNRLVVEWTTTAEFGTVGFDIYRVPRAAQKPKSLDGATLLTPAMIDAQGSPVSGASYEFTDPTPYSKNEVRGYLLVETEVSGNQILYGPVWYPAQNLEANLEEWMGY